jgi:hypothetical protein
VEQIAVALDWEPFEQRLPHQLEPAVRVVQRHTVGEPGPRHLPVFGPAVPPRPQFERQVQHDLAERPNDCPARLEQPRFGHAGASAGHQIGRPHPPLAGLRVGHLAGGFDPLDQLRQIVIGVRVAVVGE